MSFSMYVTCYYNIHKFMQFIVYNIINYMQDFFFHKVLYSNLNRIFKKIAKIFQLYAMKNKIDLN